MKSVGLPWWLSGKEFAGNAGNAGSISGSGRSPEEGKKRRITVLRTNRVQQPFYVDIW